MAGSSSSDGRLVGVDLAAARAAVSATIDHLRETMGEEAWQRGMNPDVPETAILENPYTVHRVGRRLGAMEALGHE